MSITLNGSNQYLRSTSPSGWALPLTICAWFKASNASAYNPVADVDNTGTAYNILTHFGNSSQELAARSQSGGTAYNAVSSSTMTDNNWHHGAAVFVSSSSRKVYLDGGSLGTNTNAVDGGTSYVSVGRLSTLSLYFGGKISHVAIWGAELSAGDIALLAAGMPASSVQPGSLLGFWPLYEDALDDAGSNDLTAYNSPSFDTGDEPPLSGGTQVDLDFTMTGTGLFPVVLKSTVASQQIILPQAIEVPFIEHLLFKTTVLRSVDGAEQRVPLRKVPRRSIEARVIDRLQLMDSILHSKTGSELSVPRWYEPAYTTAAASLGDDTVYVNTTALSEFVEGEYALVSQSSFVYDVLEIETVNSDNIVFANLLTHDFRAGVQVVPISRAYVDGPVQAVKRMGEGTFDMKLLEMPVDNDLGLTPYAPHELTIDDANYSDSGEARETVRIETYQIDAQVGTFEISAIRSTSDKGYTLGFRTHTRQELWDLRELLYKLQGKAISFYLVTSNPDLILADDLTMSQTVMDVVNCGFASYVAEERQIRVVLKSGATITKTVTSWSLTSNTVERLTVNSAWSADVAMADVDRIEFIDLVRLDTDDIAIKHFSATGDATCDVPVVRCTDATEWVFPDGFVDGATSWDDETNVYDGDSDTAATSTVAATSWSQLLELTFSRSVLTTKVRINAGLDGPSGIDECKIELYYDGGWQSFYSNDTYPDNAWFEIDLDEEKEVSSARVSFYNADSSSQDAYLYGFQLRGILL